MEKKASLISTGRLLKESWFFYFSKIKTILGVTIIPIGFAVLSRMFLNFLTSTDLVHSFWFSFIAALVFLISVFLWFWAVISLLYSFKENIGTGESYKKGIKLLPSYTRVFILLLIIIAGGHLLFIIPGFLFSVWFSLAFFVLVFENKKGFNALHRSKWLIRGVFWRVFWRFLVMGLIVGIPLFLIAFLVSENISFLIGHLVQLFIWPFFLVYGFFIYKNLSEIKSGLPYPDPPGAVRIKYIAPAVLGAFLVGILLVFYFFSIFWGRDIPPIDDSDLRLTRVEIPEEENAFFLFAEIAEKMDIIYEREGVYFDEMYYGEKWDQEFAQELIDNNQEVFELFEKVLEFPYFQFPEWQDPEAVSITTVIHNTREIRELGRLNTIKANYLFREGKEEEALDLTIKIIKMGQMLQDMPRPTLITYLVGSSLKEIALDGLRDMVPDLILPSENLKQYITELEQFKENEEGLARVMKMEYIALSNTKAMMLDSIFTDSSSEEVFISPEADAALISLINLKPTPQFNHLYKPNQTQQIFAEYYRNNVSNANKDCYQVELIEIELLASHHPVKLVFMENVIGKILHDIVAVSFDGVFERKCLEDLLIAGSQTLMAIKAFQADTGSLPASLDELVPEYLSEIPKDPFSGEAISYSAEEKKIYSSPGDIVFPIEF